MEEENISYSDYEDKNIKNQVYNSNERKNNKKIILTIIITTIIILLLTFGVILLLKNNKDNKNDSNNEIKSIYLEEILLNLVVGETKKINITIEADKPEKIPIIWTSNNEEVALVNDGQITAKKEGNAIIKASHTTKDGKEYSVECEIIVSDDKPTITYEISNKNWTNKDVTITVKAISKTNIKELKYTVNCIENCDYKQVEANKIVIKEEGINKITIIATNQGNISAEETLEVKIDKTKPAIKLSNPKTTYTGTNKVEVCATCIDNESGCKQQKICQTYTKSQSNIKLTLSDKAGNTATSSVFNVVINNNITTPTTPTNPKPSTPTCKFTGPTAATIKVGETTNYTLECTDSINKIKDTNLNANNFSLSTTGIIQITNISKTSITNGYKYTITVKGLKVGNTNISFKAGTISNSNGTTNNGINSNIINIIEACTRQQSCGCEKYTDWKFQGTQSLSASCSSNPSKTLTTRKWSNCTVLSATSTGTCTWKCNYYIKTCTQYKCC